MITAAKKRNGHTNGHAKKSAVHLPPVATVKQCQTARAEIIARKYEELRAQAKSCYDECDRLEAELIGLLPVGETVVMSDGRNLKIADNFIDANGQPKNIAWKPAGVRRFEIKIK